MATNQTYIIKRAIEKLIDGGYTDKQKIYNEVVEKLGVPRPTVRRVARDLRNDLLKKIEVLQQDLDPTGKPKKDTLFA